MKPESDNDPVAKLMCNRPLIAESLHTVDANRTAMARILVSTPMGDAIEELLGALKQHVDLCEQEASLRDVSPIVDRAVSEFYSSLHCLLCGLHTVVGDLLRTAMEAQYLFEEFAAEPHRLSDWLSLDDRDRWSEYKPVKLRERRAARLGTEPSDLCDHKEYGLHSKGVHFGPEEPWYAKRGVSPNQTEPAVTICLGEILEHGHRFLVSLNALCATRSQSTPQLEDLQASMENFYEARESVYFTLEVWKELEGRDEQEALDRLFPKNGPLDMLAILRYGHAKLRAREIRDSLAKETTCKNKET